MVDFSKKLKNKKDIDYKNLENLHNYLNPSGTHSTLRPAQIDILTQLQKSSNAKEIILKLNTGAGKTLIGLLFLYSKMNILKKPAVFLCTTNQLADQVYKESIKLNIPAEIYPSGQTHPSIEGLNSRSIIICTYDKLFNALNTFNRLEIGLSTIGAFVLDDVHAGIDVIKKAYILSVASGSNDYKKIISLLDIYFQDYKCAQWSNIKSGQANEVISIPHWIWKKVYKEVLNIINLNPNDYLFVWNNIRNYFRHCKCVISGAALEITPYSSPIEENKAYFNSEYKLFMSATIANDSILIKELGCSVDTVMKSMQSDSDKGVGERMIIAPALFDEAFNKEWTVKLACHLSKKTNVVVLVSSDFHADIWRKNGAQVATKDNLNEILSMLETSNSNIVVFVQRYDGIDLPDNMCRVLIIDGFPIGDTLIDKYDTQLLRSFTGVRNKLVHKLEQGMGRAIRSHTDYAVIILSGLDLANFASRNDVQSNMNQYSQLQLKLSLNLRDAMIESVGKDADLKTKQNEILSLISTSLRRDDDWKQYYYENVTEQIVNKNQNLKKDLLDLYVLERLAFLSANANNYEDASNKIQNITNSPLLQGEEKAYYYELLSAYTAPINIQESNKIQLKAHTLNRLIDSPHNLEITSNDVKNKTQANSCIEVMTPFSDLHGLIAEIQDTLLNMNYALPYNQIEITFEKVGVFLGAFSKRVDKLKGPDVIWIWDDIGFVIEAKTEKYSKHTKSDAAQLAHSLEWAKSNYSKVINWTPIIPSNSKDIENGVCYPPTSRFMNNDIAIQLLEEIKKFYKEFVGSWPNIKNDNVSKLLSKHNLTPKQIVLKFTEQM